MSIEKEDTNNKLLESLIRYILPIFSKNDIKENKKQNKLEELVNKEKTKFKPLELIFLEDLINSFLKDNNKIKKKIELMDIHEFEENNIQKNENNNEHNNDEEIRYFIALERKKKHKDNFGCSIKIKYEENEVEGQLNIKVTFNDENAINNYSINDKKSILNNYLSIKKLNFNKNQKNNLNDEKEYSVILMRKKENISKDNYSISIVYDNDYEEERLSINYRSTLGAYLNRRQDALHDFSDRVPGKNVKIFPANMMGSVLGFTYLGQGYMALRDDLTGDTKKMVDIHESIHTQDEYETRILTEWILAKQNTKYIK